MNNQFIFKRLLDITETGANRANNSLLRENLRIVGRA